MRLSSRLSFLSSLLFAPALLAADWPDLSTPPRTSAGDGSKDAALVIAIEDYVFAQDIPGAVQNGRDWVSWLRESRRVPVVKSLENGQATREEILQAAEGIATRVKPGGRLWVVYIGHGAPSRSADTGVLVGVDAQQTALSLEARSITLSELEDALEGSAADVVMVQDACFSGKSAAGDLAPGLSPLKAVSVSIGPKWTVLSAGRGDEYAGPLANGQRPAFSYLVLGALRGWGDTDADGVISAEEAVRYAGDTLFETVTGRQQTPERQGPNVALGRSARETGPNLGSFARPVARSTDSRGENSVQVNLGADATDFAALAREAEVADAALAEARRKQQVAKAKQMAEQRKLLDQAKADVMSAASRDYAAIESFVEKPTTNGEKVLSAWLARYGQATVEVGGVKESVVIEELAKVQTALRRASSSPPIDVTKSASGSVSKSGVGRSGYKMVAVPAGEYLMGCTSGQSDCASDQNLHLVELSYDFLIGQTEVTQGLWSRVTGNNPSRFIACGLLCPVENVSWLDVVRFANTLSLLDGFRPCYEFEEDDLYWPAGVSCTGYRLPTESEWEIAARGGRDTLYAGSNRVEEAGWIDTNSSNQTHPVGQKGANGYSLFDMSGNVWEWVWDSYGAYATKKTKDPTGPGVQPVAVNRGGSYNFGAAQASVVHRGRFNISERSGSLGFRLVRTVHSFRIHEP